MQLCKLVFGLGHCPLTIDKKKCLPSFLLHLCSIGFHAHVLKKCPDVYKRYMLLFVEQSQSSLHPRQCWDQTFRGCFSPIKMWFAYSALQKVFNHLLNHLFPSSSCIWYLSLCPLFLYLPLSLSLYTNNHCIYPKSDIWSDNK